MTESASVQILLNAHGNLGQVIDATNGKILRLATTAKGAGGAVGRDMSGAFAAFGTQSARAFGEASSAVAKFAGPLGLLGGTAALAGVGIAKALDSVVDKFREAWEEAGLLREAIDRAAKSAQELAKARDAAVLSNVDKFAGSVEPLIAQGGDAALAFARRLSLDTGASLDDTAEAVLSGTRAGLGEDQIRRLVEGSQLAARAGRAKFGDAVAAGLDGGFDASFSPAEMAAELVNRAALAAHLGRGSDGARGPLPGGLATAADFAAAEDNLGASSLVAAIQAKRKLERESADNGLSDVRDRGKTVVDIEASRVRADRRLPGLAQFMERDREIQARLEKAEENAKEKGWTFNPFTTAGDEVVKIAKERERNFEAFRSQGGFIPVAEAETPDEFMARTSAERDRLERARVQQGLPFGAGVLNVRVVNPDDLRSDPLRPAQEGE